MEKEIKDKFKSYPEHISPLMQQLRDLILNVAKDNNFGKVDEALKWGEPSYSVKYGSPIRIDWKPKTPDQYYLFFHCQTTLIEVFREIYSSSLRFNGNRAIILDINQDFPKTIIKHCVEIAMNYKKAKHLPLLGAYN